MTITQEQLNTVWLGKEKSIAHDFSNCCLIMQFNINNLSKILPSLIKGYHLAVEKKLMEADLDEEELESSDLKMILSHLDQLESLKNLIKFHIDYNEILNSTRNLKISECINQLLEKYFFENDKNQSLVEFDIRHDFEFICSPDFIQPLLVNLLNKAFISVELAKKGAIKIWTGQEENYHTLHFKDTGKGMNDNSSFNQFVLKKNKKLIPGLGFCRLAIISIGGDIICDSVENEYTHFIVKFPKKLSV